MSKRFYISVLIIFALSIVFIGSANVADARDFIIREEGNPSNVLFKVEGASGFTGLGTDSPNSILDIHTSSDGDEWLRMTTSNGHDLYWHQFTAGSAADWQLSNNQGGIMKIWNHDNVASFPADIGIGQNGTPSHTLDVNGTTNLNSNRIINLGTPVDNSDAATKSYVDSASGGGVPGGSDGQTLYNSGGDWTSTSNLYNDGSSIGIGITNPVEKLDVDGTIRSRQSNSTAGSMDTIAYRFNEGRGWGYNSNDDRVFYNAAGGEIPFWVDRNNSFFDVNVGIGDSSPSAKLDVDGSIYGSTYYDKDNTSYYVNPSGNSQFGGNIDIPESNWIGLSQNNAYIPRDDNLGVTQNSAALRSQNDWVFSGNINNSGSADFIFGGGDVDPSGSNWTEYVRIQDNGTLNMNSSKITNLGTPTANSDATTKSYVDSAAGGGVPSGSDGQTLYNSGGDWAATSNLYHDGSSVGIGTTNPETKLDVISPNTDTSTSTGFLFDRTSGSTSNGTRYIGIHSLSGRNSGWYHGEHTATLNEVVRGGRPGANSDDIATHSLIDLNVDNSYSDSPETGGNYRVNLSEFTLDYTSGVQSQPGNVYLYDTRATIDNNTVNNFYGAYFRTPTTQNGGSINNKYALVTESGAGNVGIGDITPSAQLDVDGSIYGSTLYDKDNTSYYVNPSGSSNLGGSLDMNGNGLRNHFDAVFDDFETYSTSTNNPSGWSQGSACDSTCQVDDTRAYSGSQSYFLSGGGDGWDKGLSWSLDPELSGIVTAEFKYWEDGTNTDGYLWLEAGDGTDLIQAGTENPQWDIDINGSANVEEVNLGDYQKWHHVTIMVDTRRNQAKVIFNDMEDSDYHEHGWYSLPSVDTISDVHMFASNEMWVDDVKVYQGPPQSRNPDITGDITMNDNDINSVDSITATDADFSQPITVGTPTASSDATTKSYVDSAAGGGVPGGSDGQTLYNNSGDWAATSNLYHDGTDVGIGTTNPRNKFEVNEGGIISTRNGSFDDGTTQSYLESRTPIPSIKTASELNMGMDSNNDIDSNVVGERDQHISCTENVTYSTAKSTVESFGARLPTLEEVEGGVAEGTGCGFDYEYVWTQTKCGQSGTGNDVVDHYWITAGDPAYLDSRGRYCVPEDSTSPPSGHSGDSDVIAVEYVAEKDKGTLPAITDSEGRIRSNEIRARTSDGVSLNDDGGNGLFVEDGGNVGIGATNPATGLDVSSSRISNVGTPTDNSDAATKSYVDSASGGGVPSGSDGQTLRNSGGDWSANDFLTNTGSRLGINTSDPGGNFGGHSTTSDPMIHFVDDTNMNELSEVMRLERYDGGNDIREDTGGYIGMYNSDSNNGSGEVARISWEHPGTDGSGTEGNGLINFWTSQVGQNDGDPEIRMTIDDSGNVGIGDTSPSAKLDVNGSIYGSTLYDKDNTSYYVNPSGASNFAWANSEFRTQDSNGGVRFRNSNNTDYVLELGQHGGATDMLRFVPEVAGSAQWGNDFSYNFGSSRWEVDGTFRTLDGMDAGNSKIINLATPTASSDAATKDYVDSASGGGVPGGSDGQTLYNSGGDWVATDNLYNDGTNIGIGNTNPQARLQVGDEASTAQLYLAGPNSNANSNEIYFGDGSIDTGMGIRYDSNNNRLYFDDNYDGSGSGSPSRVTRMTIERDSGNVGIGDTSPSAPLDVNGSIYGSTYYDKDNTSYYMNPSGSSNLGGSLDMNLNDLIIHTGDGLRMGRDDSYCPSNDCYFMAKTDGNSNDPDGEFTIGNRGNDGVFEPAITIAGPNNRVGIGLATSSLPNYPLDVSGNARVQGNIRSSVFYDSNNTSWFMNPSGSSNVNQLMVGSTASPNTALEIRAGQLSFTSSGGGDLSGSPAIDANNGDIVGVNKFSAATIDPLYQINGQKYATYVSDTIGIKTEIYGKADLRKEFSGSDNENSRKFSHTIDFDQVEKGSDLWLFWRTINLADDMSDMIVNLTPEGSNADIWYNLDPDENQLTIHGDKLATVSYHLVAPRHDSDEWPTETDTEDEPSFIFEEGEWIK